MVVLHPDLHKGSVLESEREMYLFIRKPPSMFPGLWGPSRFRAPRLMLELERQLSFLIPEHLRRPGRLG